MLHQMSPELYAAWKAWYILHPFGPERDDFRTGLLCAVQRGGRPGDYLKSEKQRRRESDPMFMLAQFMQIASKNVDGVTIQKNKKD